MRQLTLLITLLLASNLANAAPSKIQVDGEKLIYNTDLPSLSEDEAEIVEEDVKIIKEFLSNNPSIRSIELTSGGGDVSAAYDIVDIIMENDLDIHVVGACESACPLLLLAGRVRTAEAGSKIGFHQTSVSPENEESNYNKMKEEMGFKSPFDYVAWSMADTQEIMLNDLYYYQSLGLSLDFVVMTLVAPSDEMFYPSHEWLLKENVLSQSILFSI